MMIIVSYSSCSKYSMLGCIRIISQLVSFELVWTTMMMMVIWSWNEVGIGGYYYYYVFYVFSIYEGWIYMGWGMIMGWLVSGGMVSYWLMFSNYVVMILFVICILGESNRVPFDLPEAESELVAGFITEYSSVIFSLILFSEYASIIGMFFWMIIIFSLHYDWVMLFILVVCLIRCTLNRLRFDELMTNAWIVILPVIFSLLLFMLD